MTRVPTFLGQAVDPGALVVQRRILSPMPSLGNGVGAQLLK